VSTPPPDDPPPAFAVPPPAPPPYQPAPRRPPEQPPAGVRWGLPDAAIVTALIPVTIGLGVVYLLLRLPASQGPFTLISSGLSYAVLFAALVFVSRTRGLRSLRADFGLMFRPVDLAIGFGIAVLVRVLTLIEGFVVVGIAGKGPTRGNVSFGHDPLWIIINGLLIGALVAPIVEELLFRGLVLRAVRWAILRGPRRSPRPQPAEPAIRNRAAVIAVIVSAVIFSVLHLDEAIGDPVLLVTLGLFTLTAGLLHGIITVATGRLGPAIVAHVVFNASSVLLALLLNPH
jgi:uncharacterized protein